LQKYPTSVIVNWSIGPSVGVTLAAVIRYALAVVAETVRLTPAHQWMWKPSRHYPKQLSVAVSASSWPPERPAELHRLVNVINSDVPSLTAAPVLSVTVGTSLVSEVPSPLKVKFLSPLKLVTVLPKDPRA